MQGLSTNQIQQQRVKGLVEAAKRRGIETVAERVEDANTMAVLWQLGIEFIQGYFVNAPEDVTMSGDRHGGSPAAAATAKPAPSGGPSGSAPPKVI
jgi:EAL domain-containing protein (putative c-di-GMP-specific phosphodiesterase class I)